MTSAADTVRDEWLWGWDPAPGIVSVYATQDGRASVWRRLAEPDALVREEERFRPWLLLAHLRDLALLGARLAPDDERRPRHDPMVRHRELSGPGALRYLVSARDGRRLVAALLDGASRRLQAPLRHLSELQRLEPGTVLALPPEEQYLVTTGRTYFQDLAFDRVHRLQFDLETTGLDARRDRIFMVSIRYHSGATEVLEVTG